MPEHPLQGRKMLYTTELEMLLDLVLSPHPSTGSRGSSSWSLKGEGCATLWDHTSMASKKDPSWVVVVPKHVVPSSTKEGAVKEYKRF